jgi:putative colanic acid biosynthesis UDP-glucose lipid carrier transferase
MQLYWQRPALSAFFMKKLLAEHTELVITHPAQVRSIGRFYEHARPHPLGKRSNLFLKRAFDLVLSAILILTVFSWMLPLIAIMIIVDSRGPVFFLQHRIKRNGRRFTCIKFRTMHVNEDADLLPACMNDQRITKVGKFLRKHHLDEFPQLLNVFWGDMSLIGPRPHMISENTKYAELFDFYCGRQNVKPGISGLAQVLGYVGHAADPERMKRRVKLDLYYIRHWSPALDARIILLTALKILRS